MTALKVYLAGPEVFLRDAAEVGREKCRLCARQGFEGLFPLDNEIEPQSGQLLSRAIFSGNVAMMNAADIIVANLTPFRSVSADPGTVFEVGYAYARGKKVFGYSNDPLNLCERVAGGFDAEPTLDGDGRSYASDGFAIENFGLAENLMIVEAIRESGSQIVTPGGPVSDVHRDLRAFEACLAIVADVMGVRRRGRERAAG
jgi:nucleoside 2-deoxyribosyltransferase